MIFASTYFFYLELKTFTFDTLTIFLQIYTFRNPKNIHILTILLICNKMLNVVEVCVIIKNAIKEYYVLKGENASFGGVVKYD